MKAQRIQAVLKRIFLKGESMKTLILTILAILVYRAIENIDGEKGFKLIDYKIGQKIKFKLLDYIN